MGPPIVPTELYPISYLFDTLIIMCWLVFKSDGYYLNRQEARSFTVIKWHMSLEGSKRGVILIVG